MKKGIGIKSGNSDAVIDVLGCYCRNEDIGLVCLEQDASDCDFSEPLEHKYCCKCSIRVSVARKLRK